MKKEKIVIHEFKNGKIQVDKIATFIHNHGMLCNIILIILFIMACCIEQL